MIPMPARTDSMTATAMTEPPWPPKNGRIAMPMIVPTKAMQTSYANSLFLICWSGLSSLVSNSILFP